MNTTNDLQNAKYEVIKLFMELGAQKQQIRNLEFTLDYIGSQELREAIVEGINQPVETLADKIDWDDL